MKRILPLFCLLMLLCTAPAQAALWFPDGQTLHRDPLCIHNTFSAESCLEKTLTLSLTELEDTDYLPCTHCCAALSSDETTDSPPVLWYFNPSGGERLHRNPDCPSVSAKYKPLIEADRLPAHVLPTAVCNVCGHEPITVEYLFDSAVWNTTPVEKARMLPGVWTLPSPDAIPFTDAMSIGKEWALQYSDKSVHSAIAFHYDHDPQGNPRETWQVLVTTTLMQPVCIAHIDALSGEVYSGVISREYSDKMLLDHPDKLCLEAAEGARVEILANRVNLRETPGGDFIARVDKGDILPLLGEGRKGLSLWYCVDSPKYGEGYVSARYAHILHNGQMRGSGSAMTDSLLAYCQDLRRWQISSGFLAKDASGQFVFTMDKSLDTERAKEEVLHLMQQHGIIAATDGSASFLLANHYGLDNLWRIFTEEEFLPGLRQEDWHSPDMPDEEEARLLAEALADVDQEYR